MKTLTNLVTLTTIVLGLSASYTGLALGIHSSELAQTCTGTVEITGVRSQDFYKGFFDRANNYHPPHGYAYFDVKVKTLDDACLIVEEELGVEIANTTFSTGKNFKGVSDLASVGPLAQKEVGKVYPFKLEQHFLYKEDSGFLPFYPLLYKQILSLKAEIGLGPTLEAKPIKSYLTEEEKVELTQAIFAKLKSNQYTNTPFNNSLHFPLTELHPKYESNFKVYLTELLALYSVYENQKSSDPYYALNVEFTLLSLANNISKLTHSYPEYYQFDIPLLISQHPSLLHLNQLPNMTAIDLEDTLEILEQNFKNNTMSEVVKMHFTDVLKSIAGHYGQTGGAVVQITSQKSEDLAKHLLATYYVL